MTAGNMTEHVVGLEALGTDRVEIEDSFEPGEIDFSPEGLRQAAAICWSGFVERSGDEIRLCGRLETILELVCVRCLDPISQRIKKQFDFFPPAR